MRFEYYHAGLDPVPKLSVDGTVANSFHFSHWEGNETPPELKADTSTEIALNLVTSPRREEFTHGIDLVTNNHFDTDGVLSVWTVLTGERALHLKDELISAAEAGDFSELTSVAGVRASITIQGPDQAGNNSQEGSPLARLLNGGEAVDDAESYQLILPEVERVLTNVDAYEHLWRDNWEQIERALDSFESGSSTVAELSGANTTLVTISPEVFGATGFDPNIHGVPVTAISKYARGDIFLIAIPYRNGWSYRFDYPYYSWAETVVRPHIERRDLTTLLLQLNEAEQNKDSSWQRDGNEMTSAIKFLDAHKELAASRLRPDEVAKVVCGERASLTAGVK